MSGRARLVLPVVLFVVASCSGADTSPQAPFDPAASLPHSVAGIALTVREPTNMAQFVAGLPDGSGPVAIATTLGLARVVITSSAEVGDFPSAAGAPAKTLDVTETVYTGASPDRLLAAYLADRTGPMACPACAVAPETIANKSVAVITSAALPARGLFAYVKGDVLYEIAVNDLEVHASKLASAALALLP